MAENGKLWQAVRATTSPGPANQVLLCDHAPAASATAQRPRSIQEIFREPIRKGVVG
jgi:hypothetical protein